MSDLLSKLRELKEECLQEYTALWVVEDIAGFLKTYGWHDASEPPTETACYLVTLADPSGDYLAMAYWDPRHYKTDGWQIHGVIGWMSMPELYKPEAAK